MTLSEQNGPSKGQPQEPTPGMDAAPSQVQHAPRDPAMALLVDVLRVWTALGNVRCQLAAIDLPPELATTRLADDQANVAGMLQVAENELGSWMLNVKMAATGENTIAEPARRRIHLPADQLLEALRESFCEIRTDLHALDADSVEAHHEQYAELVEQLDETGKALHALHTYIAADVEDEADEEEGGEA